MILFFDMDDTLYDRAVPFMEAFEIFTGKKDSETAAKAYKTSSIRSNEVFEDSQTGRITMEEMYIYRYKMGLADVGISISDEDALHFQHLYKERQKEIHLSDTMMQILDYCSSRAERIGVITNGPGPHQRNKMASLGLERWTDPGLLFISGEVKVTKPNPYIFECAAKAAGVPVSELWMIGDNYSVDIETAANLGWNTIWLNKNGAAVPEGSKVPTITVLSEEGLFTALRAVL